MNFPPPEAAQDLIPEEGIDFNIGGLGVVAEWDSRNHSFQPSGGQPRRVSQQLQPRRLSAPISTTTPTRWHSTTIRKGFRDQDVFAWRVSLCSTSDDTPFFERCQFGSSNDLRGYPVGRYYDDAMYAAQIEYRAPLWRRLGRRGLRRRWLGGQFVSAISVPSDTLAAGGVGLRILASKEQRLNVSIDFAVGRDESTLYMYIGEAFYGCKRHVRQVYSLRVLSMFARGTAMRSSIEPRRCAQDRGHEY